MKSLLLLSLLIFLSVIGCTKIPDERLKYNPVKDIDGNEYYSIVLGDQEWMIENLATAHFNDGSDILLISNDLEWEETTKPGYCWYFNVEPLDKKIDGAFYNFYSVNSGKLCPIGWHIPSDEEWKIFELYLGIPENEIDMRGWRGEGTATLLKAREEWNCPEGDQYGFKALPLGFRNGCFGERGEDATWWTSTKYDDGTAWAREICNRETTIDRNYTTYNGGFSVRCIKNNK